MACRACRTRKIKCDGTRPTCSNCSHRSISCIFTTERSKRRRLDDHVPPFAGNYRFVAHVASGRRNNEKLLDKVISPQHEVTASTSQPAASGINASPAGLDDAGVDEETSQFPWPASERSCSEPIDGISSPLVEEFHPKQKAELLPLIERILAGDDSDPILDRSPAVWIRIEDGGEYTGPSSGISILSDLNLRWLRTNIRGSEVLCRTLKGVRSGILSHLTRPKCIADDLWPDPENPFAPKPLPIQREIERFVESYFSDVQVIYPVLDRSRFEARLHKYYDDPSGCTDSWRALLYAVVASGCRAALSDETAEAFRESGREAWAYFRGALCYETKLVHGATDLTAVQAFAVMAVFAQGMSSPQRLEYTLCSTASRLAHGLALHLCPPPEWSMSEGEKHERNRTFWVLYCLDKTIALRTGRPPTIRDDQVGCLFPRDVSVAQNTFPSSTRTGQSPGDDIQEFDFFLMLTQFSRICSRISHQLYSATALCRPAAELVEMANSILSSLEAWRQRIPVRLRPVQSFNRLPALNYASRQRVLTLHLSYNYAICSVHRRFMRFFTDYESAPSNRLRAMLTCKPLSHIEAARSMVLLTKHLDIESYAPAWLVFYYPMTAITTIFMHIVCNPLATSVSNDIALMDTVVGFFGRLEFITSGEAAFTRMGELVQQARSIVLSARDDAAQVQEHRRYSNVSQLATLTATMSGDSISVEQEIDRSSNKARDVVVVNDFDTPSMTRNGRGTGQDGPGQSLADGTRCELGNTSAVNNNVDPLTLASNESLGGNNFVDSAEHLQQSLDDFTQPMTGLFPGGVLNVDWLDTWMMSRQSANISYDRDLQSWT